MAARRMTLERAATFVLKCQDEGFEVVTKEEEQATEMLARAVLEAAKRDKHSREESRIHKAETGRDLTGYHHGVNDTYSAMKRAARGKR